MATTIVLDAGHGAGRAHNRGGVCFNEGDNNFYYSLVLKAELERYQNVKVILTRPTRGGNPTLAARKNKGRGADLFLSLHSNAAGATVRGTEVYDRVKRRNQKLAADLSAAIAKQFGHNNRGVKYKRLSNGTSWYGVLRNNPAGYAMILEHGFHTNKTDCEYFKNNPAKIARETAKVIASHYRLKLKSGPAQKPSVDYTSYGDSGAEVKRIQELLSILGYTIKIRGGFGKEMESVVKEFQKDHGLAVDGIVGPATIGKLHKLRNDPKVNKFFRRGTTGKDVKNIQADLSFLGYDISVDGHFGAGTEKTIKEFQKDNKLPVDGSAGPATRKKITEKVKEEKNKPTEEETGKTFVVQAGRFSERKNAEERVSKLKKSGVDSFIKEE